MVRFVSVIGVVALVFSFPVLAKDKNGQNAPGVPSEQAQVDTTAVDSLTAPVLADAIRLCGFLVDDDPAIVDALENEGWTHEIDRNTGNAPFYKELSAEITYEGVGKALIWGFIEDYPDSFIGYCSLTIDNPEVRLSISAINQMENITGEIKEERGEVFGMWRDVSDHPSIFIHAYHNSDTFTYQITRISKLN